MTIVINLPEAASCPHRIGQWIAWENGLYRLFCACCGQYLEQESWMQETDGPFEINAWPFDYADEHIQRTFGRG